MSGALVLFLSALRLSAPPNQSSSISYVNDVTYYDLPRFWTNTGFCPAGGINYRDLTATLLSNEVQMNLRQISALPNGAVTHVRIHWLLELIQFVAFSQSGVPIYDFTDLDEFLLNLDELQLQPVIEFMANPGDVFTKVPTQSDLLWENFSFQVAKHYLNLLGASKVMHWRFETWNEPDLANYNKLNFTVEDYLSYVHALRRGLNEAGRRPANSIHFSLQGPAGLFKADEQHPRCWTLLQKCNSDMSQCPIETLTYHRKGNGTALGVLTGSRMLLKEIYGKFPALTTLPVANDEADPISGWSTPRAFHEDVLYATALVTIVLVHWGAKIQRAEFQQLQALSHDNAFLSYHPYEFSQRTLLAHFRMNISLPVHSQFIQKPVYAAMGMLSKLAPLAANLETLVTPTGEQIVLLKTTDADPQPFFLSWLMLPQENSGQIRNFILRHKLPIEFSAGETLAFVIETLEQQRTDPAYVWRQYGQPAFPNASIRAAMRRAQAPKLHSTGVLIKNELELNVGDLEQPWVLLFRVCSNCTAMLKQPSLLTLTVVTQGEVFISWREATNSTRCLKTYEVWYRRQGELADWIFISNGWQLPFPSFQFAPSDGRVNGFYRVRGVDIFNRTSSYSDTVEYIEV